MELLTSPLIAAPHGFSTRAGGVSPPPFDSLNVGLAADDAAPNVATNLAALAAAVGVAPARLATVSQVHGDRVLHLEGLLPERPGVPAPLGEADALWTRAAGQAVGVKTADCAPLLLWDAGSGAVAAVHAGWRGTLARIAVRAVEALLGQGSALADLQIAVGPCIGPCCYAVAGDLPERFSAAFGAQVLQGDRLDLRACLVVQLREAGLSAAQLDLSCALCTSCDARFFSHRRDQGRTGRQLSLIRCG
jgi:YfiH family protein